MAQGGGAEPVLGGPEDPGDFATLPAGLRTRIVALAARGLGEMPLEQVPPTLRLAANFAPARRAKLAGQQIAAAVGADEEFRRSLAVQVRALAPELVTAIEAGTPTAPEQAVETAALTYLVRPPGWEAAITAVRVRTPDSRPDSTRDGSAADRRLHVALATARAETRAVRERLRRQLDSAKTDNTSLRQTLASTRQLLSEAEAAAASNAAAAEVARRDAAAAARAADAEARRLRGRIGELEASAAGSRRASKESRDAESTRLRLLLETVTEAAAGLRRELALPPADLLPADTVTAVKPAPADSAHRAGLGLLNGDPELLRRLLELPRPHLMIDGYNVSKATWPAAPLDQQRARLISGVAAFVAGRVIETTVIFDGANADDAPSLTAPRSLRVRFSPPGVIADDLIRQLVASEPRGRPVIVVSDDRELAESVVRRGARSVATQALVRAMRA